MSGSIPSTGAKIFNIKTFNMKKEFLDGIYNLRVRVVQDIERLVGLTQQNRPAPCSTCESDCDESIAELRTRRSQLSSIDTLIESYLEHHPIS